MYNNCIQLPKTFKSIIWESNYHEITDGHDLDMIVNRRKLYNNLPIHCASTLGLNHISKTITWEADVRLIPHAPARREMINTSVSLFLNADKTKVRFSFVMSPVSKHESNLGM